MKRTLLYFLGLETVEDITQDLHSYKKKFLRNAERRKAQQTKHSAKAERSANKASAAKDQAVKAARKARQLDAVIGDAEAP